MPGQWLPDDVWLLQKLMTQMGGMGGMGSKGGKGQWGTGGATGGLAGKGASKGKGKGGKGPTKKAEDPDKSWKARLHEAYTKTKKEVPTKDLFEYTTESLGEAGYSSILASSVFSDTYASPDVLPSKKLAEEAAAKVALQAEYPDIFAKIPASIKNKSLKKKAAPVQVKLEKGQKRPAGAPPQLDHKGKLYNAVARLIPRPLTKEDIVFEVAETAGKLTAKVTMTAFEGVTVAGKAVDAKTKKKKDAENNAAHAALIKYSKEFREAEVAHKEKKALKDAEWEQKKALMEASK
jgi:hypothetical protein